METSEFRMSVTMPAGSTLAKTDAVVSEIESRLASIPEKEDIVSRIEEDQATVTINLKEDWDKKSRRKLAEIKNDISEKTRNISSAEISMDEISTSGGFTSSSESAGMSNPGADFESLLGIGSKPESVIIKGQNFEQMKNLADDIRTYINNLETVDNARINVQDNTPEVRLHFDMDYIARNGYTLGDLASALSSFGREYSSGATFRQGTESYDIMIILGILFMFFDEVLRKSQWNIFLNPFSPAWDVSETTWAIISLKNRIILIAGSILFLLAGLYNLQKREKFM
ncbi:MAG: efflux RND transporter permease subunit [Bacteroidales bacterium]